MVTYTDEQLTAFIDGELPSAHMRAIERAIETDPELSVRVASLHMETGGLKALFDSWLNKAPEEKLKTMLPALRVENTSMGGKSARATITQPIVWGPALMIGTLALMIGYGLGQSSVKLEQSWVEQVATQQSFVTEATLAGLPTLEGGAVTKAAALLGLSLDPQSITPEGYALKGVNELAYGEQPFVQFSFASDTGAPLALSVLKSGAPEMGVEMSALGDLTAASWAFAGYSFALTGKGDATVVETVAEKFSTKF